MADVFTGLGFEAVITRYVPALLVLVFIYAVLSFTKVLGENKFVQTFTAFVLAAIFLASARASALVAFAAPWFVLLFIFIIFILMAFKSMGVSDSAVMSALGKYRSISWWIISVSILIAIVGLGNVLGQGFLTNQPGYQPSTNDGQLAQEVPVQPGSTATDNFQSNVISTLFNAKILGFVAIMLISAFTVYFMTATKK